MATPSVPRYDLTGQKFGRLTVLRLSLAPRETAGAHWVCACDCGTEKTVIGMGLRKGHTRSCGCLHREQIAGRNSTHGLSGSSEHRSWLALKTRCSNPNQPTAKHYVGRGITLCDRWQDFAAFYADMGKKPTTKHTIERIDNNGPYCPGNCRWATRQEQTRNKRGNRRITFGGRTQLLIEWAEELGMPVSTLHNRLKKWTIERAMTETRKPATIRHR